MRVPTEYEKYLRRMKDYYKIKQLECPSWISKASVYYSSLYHTKKDYSRMCKDSAISKLTMDYLSKLEPESLEDLPKELVKGPFSVNTVLIAMYNELISNKELYFINEWTLSKKGRKKMREFIDRIPTAYGILPPKNEFTNVPDDVSFSNQISVYGAKYQLSMFLTGSCVYIHVKDKEERLPFTESFLDQIIPIVQREKIEPFLQKRDYDKSDETLYQDFKTVHVESTWGEFKQREYDMNLLEETQQNPFLDILKLVWEEYGQTMKEKEIVLPWFEVLGWK